MAKISAARLIAELMSEDGMQFVSDNGHSLGELIEAFSADEHRTTDGCELFTFGNSTTGILATDGWWDLVEMDEEDPSLWRSEMGEWRV